MRLALDVFAVEPLPADSALRDVPDAILTPHMVGHTVETGQASLRMVLTNIERVLAGVPPSNIRNPSVVEAWRRRWGSQ
jgi:D-3-phosphoglycerate dehydrogenase